MRFDAFIQDIRYAARTLRRAPLFAGTVVATIGLGLGLLGSAFTLLNAYLLKPIDLPDPHALYALTWDTEMAQGRRFRIADYEALQREAQHFSQLAAAQDVTVRHSLSQSLEPVLDECVLSSNSVQQPRSEHRFSQPEPSSRMNALVVTGVRGDEHVRGKQGVGPRVL